MTTAIYVVIYVDIYIKISANAEWVGSNGSFDRSCWKQPFAVYRGVDRRPGMDHHLGGGRDFSIEVIAVRHADEYKPDLL